MIEKKTIGKLHVGLLGLILCLLGSLMACARAPELERIEITPDTATITPGERIAFNAVGISSRGEKTLGIPLKWSIEQERLASIDQNGVLLAKKPGNVVVKATSVNITGEVQVTIRPGEVARMAIQPEKENALAGTTVHLQIMAVTEEDKPAGFSRVTVSSPTEGAFFNAQELILDEKGEAIVMVTLAPKPGANAVVARSGKVVQEIKLEGTTISRLTISPAKEKFEMAETVTFRAEGYDRFGNHQPVKAQWSVTGKNAETKDGGTVSMIMAGPGVIVAQYEDITAGHPFTVIPGELDKIELKPETIKLKAGQTVKVKVEGKNRYGHALPIDVEWIHAEDLGSISKDGTFLAKEAGTGTIAASVGEISATTKVVVEHSSLVDIRFEIEEKRVEAGEEIKLKAEGLDAFGNVFSITPEWSLDTSLGTINQQASSFTAQYSGRGEIIAKVEKVLKGYEIEVVPTTLSQIRLSPTNSNLVAGDTVAFSVTGYDRFGNRIDVKPEFSLNEDLGELMADGKFTALKAGATTLEAKVGEISTTTTVTVTAAEMEQVAVKPKAPVSLVAGNVLQLSAYGIDAYDNIVKSTVAWSLNPADLGTVDTRGVLTPTKAGHGHIIAEVKGLKTGKIIHAKISLAVRPGDPVRIEVDPSEIVLVAGEEKQFTAAAYDNYGNQTETAVQWSVDESVLGNMDKKGLFKAIKAGKGKVEAKVENIAGEGAVKIVPAEIAFLKITPDLLSLVAGEKIRLEAVAEDRFGNVVPAEVIWKISDERLGTITAENFFVAQKEGRGFLVGAARNIVKKLPVEVKKGALATMQLGPTDQRVASGEKVTFNAIGLDSGGNELVVQPEWSVQPKELGSIDSQGIFTAVKAGKGNIIATSQKIEMSTPVMVTPGKPAKIQIEPKQINVVAGEELSLELKTYDTNGNAIPGPAYHWEIANELGTVSKGNVFRAHRAGEGEIKVTSDQATAVVPVEVELGPVYRVEVVPATLDIEAGGQSPFSALGYDQEGNEVSFEPIWSVAGGIGSIDNEGVFTACFSGQGYVSCQAGNVAGISIVKVQPGMVTKIQVEPANLQLRAGKSYLFSADAFDVQGNEAPATFRWHVEADKELGTIDASGTFRAQQSGRGRIIASWEKIKGYSEIEVIPATMIRLQVSPNRLTIVSGAESQFRAWGEDEFGNPVTVTPRWRVDLEELGKISKEGVFKARKAGKGRIKAAINGFENGVEVEIKPGAIKYIEIQSPDDPIQAGRTYQFKAIGYDQGDNRVPLEAKWGVTEKVGEIENNTGIFKASKVGGGLVVAYYQDIAATAEVKVNPGELEHIFLEPNPVTIASNSIQIFEAKGLDTEKNSLSLPELQWKIEGRIGTFEKPKVFRGIKEGKGKVVATLGKLQAEAYVTVIPGEPDTEHSRLRVARSTVPSDGKTTSEIIVEVRDVNNNPVSGVAVKVISDRQDDLIEQPAKTDQQGTGRGYISSTKPGKATLRAVIKDQTLRDTAEVVFKDYLSRR